MSILNLLCVVVGMSYANSSGSCESSGTGAGVRGDGLADDEAILDKLADGLPRVGVGDFIDLARV